MAPEAFRGLPAKGEPGFGRVFSFLIAVEVGSVALVSAL